MIYNKITNKTNQKSKIFVYPNWNNYYYIIYTYVHNWKINTVNTAQTWFFRYLQLICISSVNGPLQYVSQIQKQ